MIQTSSIKDQLLALFNSKNYNRVVSLALENDISPLGDPESSNLVAAALFQLSKFDDCLLWCEGLAPSMNGDVAFASMYGATLRRLNRLEEASAVFQNALLSDESNPVLRNNYTNLLIDQKKYHEAQSILSELVSAFPDYNDAKVNLERVNFYIASDIQESNSEANLPDDGNFSVLDDPLAHAFSDDEVARAGGLPKSNSEMAHTQSAPNDLTSNLSLDEIASRSTDKELSDMIQLIRSTAPHDPKVALNDLTSLHKQYGSKPFIHELAAEVYIISNNFVHAEIQALTAIQLGGPTPSLYLNLANLAYMRGDQILAIHWLEMASTNFPDFDQIDPVKSKLLQNGLPKVSTTPFTA